MSGVRVKICGVTRPEDALAASRLGASAIGMIFWPGSPRRVSLEAAAEIAGAAEGLARVGVFVDQPPALVAEAASRASLDAVQLHGREAVAEYRLGLPIVKSFGVGPGWKAAALVELPEDVLPLLDAADDRRKGGTGSRIDWTAAAAAASARRIVLAGGLTPANVAAAIQAVGPYAIDVSSGVEQSPGVKDSSMIDQLLEAVRRAAGDIPRGLL